MSSSSFFRNTAMLAGAAVVLGLASPGFAQTPNSSDGARCQALYAQWTKYNGGSAYSKQLDADEAAEQCNKGNTTAGIADLTRILERARIPVPQTETATTTAK